MAENNCDGFSARMVNRLRVGCKWWRIHGMTGGGDAPKPLCSPSTKSSNRQNSQAQPQEWKIVSLRARVKPNTRLWRWVLGFGACRIQAQIASQDLPFNFRGRDVIIPAKRRCLC